MGYNYLPSCNYLHIGVQVEATSFILSSIISKSLFAGILTSEIIMQKLALKIGLIPQSEWFASLSDASEAGTHGPSVSTQALNMGMGCRQ